MTFILVAFFAVVIAVNMLMATLAVKGFGGTVVDNSYVASQKFNGWLEEARAQERLGWRERLALDDQRRVTLTITGPDGAPLHGAVVSGMARHPVGRVPGIPVAMTEIAPGQFIATTPLPSGRWQLAVSIRHDTDIKHVALEVQ